MRLCHLAGSRAASRRQPVVVEMLGSEPTYKRECDLRQATERHEKVAGNNRAPIGALLLNFWVRQCAVLLRQLGRIIEDDLWLPAVIADLPRHTDMFSEEQGFGHPKLCPIASEDHRGEGRIRIGLIEIEERRLRARGGRELG
jgi:hypothetical protein